MRDILIYFTVWLGCIILHLLGCRLTRAKTLQVIPFVMIALVGAILGLRISLNGYAAVQTVNSWNIPLSASAFIFFLLLIPLYLMLYFNTQVESPTQRILRMVKGKNGMTLEELQDVVTDRDFVLTRLSDLQRCGYTKEKDGHLCLTRRGAWVARFLAIYQKILGREMGG